MYRFLIITLTLIFIHLFAYDRANALITDGYDAADGKIHMVGGNNSGKPYVGFILNRQEKAVDSLVLNGYFNNAFLLYSKMAEDGDIYAAHNLGLMYLRGLGITKDLTNAIKYLKISMQKLENWNTANVYYQKAIRELDITSSEIVSTKTPSSDVDKNKAIFPNNFKELLLNSLSSKLNMSAKINGIIDLSLNPSPHVMFTKLIIGSENSSIQLTIEKVEFNLAPAALLIGKIDIQNLKIESPKLNINNSGKSISENKFSIPSSEAYELDWGRLSRDILIRNGEVVFRQEPNGESIVFSKIQLQSNKSFLNGPSEIIGAAEFQNEPVDISLKPFIADASGRQRTQFNFNFKKSEIRSEINGYLNFNSSFRFDGKISIAGKTPWPDISGLKNKSWSIITETKIDDDTLELRTLTVHGGDYASAFKFEGSGLGTIGANGIISARLEAKQFDLDKPMMSEGNPAPKLANVLAAWKSAIVALPRASPLLPTLDLSLSVDEMLLGGENLKDIDIGLRISKKGIAITRANASLPGDATVKVKGTASLDYGGSFSGHFNLDAKDAPHLLGWLESESSGRSSRVGDAKVLSIDTDLSLSPFNFGASNLKLAIDKSLMTGLVTYNLPEQGARGKLIAQFYSERLLLEQVPDARAVTNRLSGTDIELTIRADNVEVPKAAGSQAGKMVLKASASENGIVIDALDIADLGGASVKASGRLTAAGEKIDLKIDAPNAAPLMALVKKLIPGNVPVYLSDRAKALSPLKMAISAERGADPLATVKFNFNGFASTTALNGQGLIKRISDDPDVSMKFDASTTDAAQGLRQFGFDVVPLPLEGGAKLSGSIEGRYNQGLVVNLLSSTGGVALEGNWRADLAQSRLAGSLTIASPDLVPMLEVLSLPVPDPSLRIPFKLQTKLNLSGDQIKLNDINGTWLGQSVGGTLALDTNLDRIEGTIETGSGRLAVNSPKKEFLKEIHNFFNQKKVPPVVSIISSGDNGNFSGNTVEVRYSVRSPSGTPIDRVDALVDGRPVDMRGLSIIDKSAPVDSNTIRTLSVPAPPRDFELSLIAYSNGMASEAAKTRMTFKGSVATTEADLLKPKLYVLAIGVSDYKDPALKLKFASKDALDFAQVWSSQKGDLYKDVTVKTLLDQDATRDTILDALEWLEKQVTAKDVGIVFFAGHGINDQINRFWVLPSDGTFDTIRKRGVSKDELLSTMTKLPGKAILFLDACHSAAVGTNVAMRSAVDINKVVNEFSSAENGIVIFTSSTGRELSMESPDWGNGAFTKALVEGIGSGKADLLKKGRITLSGLYAYVTDRVKEITDGRQHPVFNKPDTVQDYPIAVVR